MTTIARRHFEVLNPTSPTRQSDSARNKNSYRKFLDSSVPAEENACAAQERRDSDSFFRVKNEDLPACAAKDMRDFRSL